MNKVTIDPKKPLPGEWITKQEIANRTGLHRNTISNYFKKIGLTGRMRISPDKFAFFCAELVFVKEQE